MLAYTAADSLNAITRSYDFGSQPTIVERMIATQGNASRSLLRSLYRRALQRVTSPHRP